MVENELTAKITVDVEGLGDAETYTVDSEVAGAVAELIKRNLRNRYTFIEEADELDILALEAPNVVAVHRREDDAEDEADAAEVSG